MQAMFKIRAYRRANNVRQPSNFDNDAGSLNVCWSVIQPFAVPSLATDLKTIAHVAWTTGITIPRSTGPPFITLVLEMTETVLKSLATVWDHRPPGPFTRKV
ncbi:hypothetical protein SCLCIDRAFT_1225085 [Scleroderma citrinum Foug A]|uniref:Uncharacterized protein n=1 Tax=Scleroderma citrinum Foug A TaxID=1036808 RepID=A0A0C3CQF6_9AGAM|nr:hypothetical protein SCLCIDRAFT_1225085 [Scleroderma citrinum Foug A]